MSQLSELAATAAATVRAVVGTGPAGAAAATAGPTIELIPPMAAGAGNAPPIAIVGDAGTRTILAGAPVIM